MSNVFAKRLVATVDEQTVEKVRLIAFAIGALNTSDAIRALIDEKFTELSRKPEFAQHAKKITQG